MKKQLQNEPDIAGLIIKVQERLTSLENKVDILVSRILPRPAEVKPFPKPFQQPVNTQAQSAGRHDNRYRVMHKVICADCKKECEIPFKPSGDRPVYCQGCFSRRKAGNSAVKVSIDSSLKETVPAQVTTVDESPLASEKKKPAVKKKPAEKKKPVSKKRKKK